MNADLPSYDDRHFKGREDERDRLKDAIGRSESVVVYGLAGIGKSALVSAAYSDLAEALDVRRHYLDCDRWDTVELLLARLAESIQVEVEVTTESSVVQQKVVDTLKAAAERTLLVFDNLETVWERPGEQWAIQNLLDELAPLKRISVVTAMRAGALPDAFAGTWMALEVKRLAREPAADLFISWAGEVSADKGAIEDFVDRELEGVPLAIELLARATSPNGEEQTNFDKLREQVQAILLKMPLNVGRDRQRSLVASLQISTQQLEDHDDSRRLMALLGALPAGISEQDLIGLGPKLSLGDPAGHARRLSDLGLAFFSEDARLETLKPIRDYAEHALWPATQDLAAAASHYLGLVPGGDGDKSSNRRAAAESANIASMAATLPDRIAQCAFLIRQGDAELKAGQFALALNTFRAAAHIARGARDSRLLAAAALGISGGQGGSGHSFDRADEERLAVLRDANHLLTDDDPALKLEVMIRLMAELHFDASFQAMKEREELDVAAERLQPDVDDPAVRLQLALRKLKGAAPTDSLDERLRAARDVMDGAGQQGDAIAEVEAGHVLVAFLMEQGHIEVAGEERKRIATRIGDVDDEGRRGRFDWQDKVIARAEMLFAGDFVEAQRELGPEPDTDDPTNSPYRRWLHQRVLLALDHDGEDFVPKVEKLTRQLKELECRKFGLAEPDLGTKLAYEWWPTWRSTLALALAARGGPGDSETAHTIIKDLSRRNASAGETAALFSRILKHEYYVQVLALIALAVQRLCVLASTEEETTTLRWGEARRTWARELDRLLEPFGSRAVVPGSCVMNLGSVATFRAMLKACSGDWYELEEDDLFGEARRRNEDLGSPPAGVRTLVTQAEMECLRPAQQGTDRAAALAREGLDLARQYDMRPWIRRAEEVLGPIAAV
jgi:hypothetical protein